MPFPAALGHHSRHVLPESYRQSAEVAGYEVSCTEVAV